MAIQNQNQNSGQGGNQGQGHANPDHTKADGTPDRRYLENRGGESQAQGAQGGSENSQGSEAQSGGMINGEHVTAEGKPDMRYGENRKKSDEQVNQEWSENIANGASKPTTVSQDPNQGGSRR